MVNDLKMIGKAVLVWMSVQTWALAQLQLTPETLADHMDPILQEQIKDINRLRITSSMASGPVQIFSETSRFRKVVQDGRAVLAPVDEDGFVFAVGLNSDLLLELVRKASSVARAAHEGKRAYQIDITDPDVLREIGQMGDHDALKDFEPKSATLWLDASDFRIHRIQMAQAGPSGDDVDVELFFAGYQLHRGLPIARAVLMKVTGMEAFMEQPEMRQAMRQLERMKSQLEQMPPEQRAMIEAMLAPQMAQLEEMLAGGAMEMEIEITDVRVE